MAETPAPAGSPAAAADPDLERRLTALRSAIAAGEALGLDTRQAQAVASEAEGRLRLPIRAFVLALVGGTGVGKSSLLNALAGTPVSKVGVQRPTTERPVAWISSREAPLGELLEWLGVEETRRVDAAETDHAEGGEGEVAPLALLDLPDLDSIDADHRRRVEAMLPRIDAVAWVTDPEKYADALLHDEFLRRWAPRLGHQALVVNKVDRLPVGSEAALVADVERLLVEDAASMPVLRAQAAAGDAGVAAVRAWLRDLAAAKAVAVRRIEASVADAIRELAAAAGIDATGHYQPLVPPETRRASTDETVARLEALVTGHGELARVAVAATTHVAQDAGGLLARARRIALGVGSGAPAVTPRLFLARWRDRSSALTAAEPAADALALALGTSPPALRSRVAAVGQPLAVAARLEPVLDGLAAAVSSDDRPPRSGSWRAAGFLQLVALAIVVVGGGWLLAGLVPAISPFVPRPPSDVASYLAWAVVLAVIGAFLVRQALRLHARYLGRRWARRLTRTMTESLREAVPDALYAPIDEIEASRGVIAGSVIDAVTGGAAPSAIARPLRHRR